MLYGQLGKLPLHLVSIKSAGRIARRVCDQNFRARRNLRGKFVGIRLEAISFGKPKGHSDAAQPESDGRVAGKARVGVQHFVSRVDERHHRHEEGDLAAGSDDDVIR